MPENIEFRSLCPVATSLDVMGDMQERGFDTFPMMIEMAIFTTKHFFDHLGNTYTKDVKARMLKDKQVYTKELITNYKNFSKKLVI